MFSKLTTTFSNSFEQALENAKFREMKGVQAVVGLINRLAVETFLAKDDPNSFLMSEVYQSWHFAFKEMGFGFEIASRAECNLELVPGLSAGTQVIQANVRFYGKGQGDVLLAKRLIFTPDDPTVLGITAISTSPEIKLQMAESKCA